MKIERVQLNHGQIAAFLKSGDMTALMSEHADQVAGRAGPGYRASTWHGDNRVIGSVETDTVQTMRREARDHRLLRALGG
ncbi:hypothetical protein [Trueperella bialowiezensis]|uniref:Uncharacterized protein n=1 Tax=Trueperella bialowiezensis TaxID=312285 RepID=A0A448PE53_9ACTO|nr:hypothetical protein [Trueperella bialowiezensis]VEI13217.1 Uncharacterised protein [Trueperella bialowiezensis]